MRELFIFRALDQPRPRFDFLFDGRGIDARAGELRIELADLFDALGDFYSTVARVSSQHVLEDSARDRRRRGRVTLFQEPGREAQQIAEDLCSNQLLDARNRSVVDVLLHRLHHRLTAHRGRQIRAVAAELEFLEIWAIGAQRLAHERDRADPPLPKRRLLDEFLMRQTGSIAAFKHRFALLEQPRKPLPYEVKIHAQELRGVAPYESSIFCRRASRFLSNTCSSRCARLVTKERDAVVSSTELRTASDNGARRLKKKPAEGSRPSAGRLLAARSGPNRSGC